MKTKTKNSNKPLMFTKDKGTAEQLIALGYELVKKDAEGWVFINHSDKKFDSGSSPKKVAMTNRMCI